MFGINFSEMIVCAIVALIVIGPERLPETVRTLGLWIGRFKRSLRETRETIEQHLGAEEIRRQLHTEEMMRTLDNMQEEIDTALNYERLGKKTLLEDQSQLTANESLSPIKIEHLETDTTKENLTANENNNSSEDEVKIENNTAHSLNEYSPLISLEQQIVIEKAISPHTYH